MTTKRLSLLYPLLLVLGFLVAVIILSFNFSHFFDINKTVVDIFAPGRSVSKLYLLESYLVVLLGISTVLAYFTKYHQGFKESRIRNWNVNTTLVLFVASFAFNSLTFFLFIFKYNFKVNDFFITFSNGALSSTQFTHNHVFKAIFGIFVYIFNHGSISNMDTGTAFVGLLPSWIFVAGALLFVVNLFWVFVVFVQKVCSLYKSQERPTLAVLSFVFFYGITTFILLKNIADGGFFDRAVFPVFCYLIILLYGYSKNTLRSIIILSIPYYIIIFAVIFQGHLVDIVNFFLYLYNGTLIALILFVPYHLTKAKKISRPFYLFCIFDFLLIIYMIMVSTYGSDGAITYRNQNIGSDGAVVVSYKEIQGNHYIVLPKINNLNLYLYQNSSSTSDTVGELIDQNGLLDSYYPVSVPWQSCVPFSNNLRYEFDLKSVSPFTSKDNNWIKVATSTETSFNNKLYSYHLVLLMNACLPQQLDVLSQFFYSQGLKTFFIYNIVQGEYVFTAD